MQSLKLDASGDLVLLSGELQLVSGPDEIAQCCKLAVGTNKGEWVLDPEMGIDFARVTGKGVTEEEIRDELTAGVLQEPRIQTVDTVTVTFDRKNRTATADFTATAVNGDVITIEGVDTVVG
jgi:phage baseplate assembly protein W